MFEYGTLYFALLGQFIPLAPRSFEQHHMPEMQEWYHDLDRFKPEVLLPICMPPNRNTINRPLVPASALQPSKTTIFPLYPTPVGYSALRAKSPAPAKLVLKMNTGVQYPLPTESPTVTVYKEFEVPHFNASLARKTQRNLLEEVPHYHVDEYGQPLEFPDNQPPTWSPKKLLNSPANVIREKQNAEASKPVPLSIHSLKEDSRHRQPKLLITN